LIEQWEKVIEYELEFYVNIQEYEDKWLERLYESQMIRYPTTTFDEEGGRVYLSCPNTEDQALARIEARESIEALLKKAVKRINRLNNALAKLNEEEQDIISIFYFERDLSELHIGRTLGFRTRKEFMDKKEMVLKKLFSMYEKERMKAHQEFKATLKEELQRKAFLFRKASPSSEYKAII
jgi:hypothetical protein